MRMDTRKIIMQAIGPKMKATNQQQAMRDAHFLVGPYTQAAPSAANRAQLLNRPGNREPCPRSSEHVCGPHGEHCT